ncbi:MAG: sodium:solute symporter [Chitinophagales bacterium]|jgi:Na+/proline symporter|nr:sodium:solute symporter [Chitinophagales bacterium]
MSLLIVVACLVIYFVLIFSISFLTSRFSQDSSYFDGDKNSPWYIIALGMLSDSLSGVTFLSVPGTVLAAKFGYMQVVYGYFFGYVVITLVLLPLYYRLNVTSIYTYLLGRFGIKTQKAGALFFLISRVLGASVRLYLAISVFQLFLFDQINVPFFVSVLLVIGIIWLYTVKGGIKTLVWTDALQSIFLILGVVFSIVALMQAMHINLPQTIDLVRNSHLNQTFFWDFSQKNYFFKEFLAGIFIAVGMTGLDQNMMQKNLTCPNLKDAQKNMFWFSVSLVFVNILFLSLGLLLFEFAQYAQIALPMKEGKLISDQVFSFLALHHLGLIAGIFFITGLIAATFSSADSVLTTLTTSYLIDLRAKDITKQSISERSKVHFSFALVMMMIILWLRLYNDTSVIDLILLFANYTYGPLIGLFFFGILLPHRKADDKWIWMICVLSPLITYGIFLATKKLNNLGNALIIVNSALTFGGLWVLSIFSKR